jgi:molybdopterin-guanine dinucleotide biosynthesis protein A
VGLDESRAVSADRPRGIAGYVLAGGGSTRFGQDKALVEFEGKPMLQRMRELLGGVLGNAVVIAAEGKYAGVGIASIADRWPGEGPLGGIITALALSSQLAALSIESNLILGCDMPFLTSEWLAYMAERATASKAEVIVPRSASGLEPLCACWRSSASAKLQRAFDSGVRKITEAMKSLDMEILDEAVWKRFDSAGRLFWNMNTPADYSEALKVLQAGQR